MTLIDWSLAERVTNDSVVDEYLENFANDPCYDNAVMLVRYILSVERSKSYGESDA